MQIRPYVIRLTVAGVESYAAQFSEQMKKQKTTRHFGVGAVGRPFAVAALLACLVWVALPRGVAALGPDEPEPRGWLGVQLAEPTETSSSDETPPRGVRVSAIIPGSPADGTLQKDDRLLEVSGNKVDSLAQLREALTGSAPGDRVSVVFIRDGTRSTLDVSLGAVPSPAELTRARLQGDRLPPFTVDILHSPDEHGYTELSSRELTEQFTLVEFWATWCPPCDETRALLTDLKSTHGSALRILAISPESKATIEGVLSDHELPYTVARDPSGAAQKACGVGQLPTIIAIDREGTVVDVFVGADHGEAIRSLTEKHVESINR